MYEADQVVRRCERERSNMHACPFCGSFTFYPLNPVTGERKKIGDL